jgi:phage shock protein PspC (stress-responsive transcriptional regulator)
MVGETRAAAAHLPRQSGAPATWRTTDVEGQATETREPSTGRPPLRRPTEGRVLAGVAAAVADHLDIDVVVVRILFVVTAIFTNGLGLVAYVLGWIFIPAADTPEGPSPSAPARDTSRDRDPLFWVGVGLLVLGALWLLSGAPGPFRWFPRAFDPGIVGPLVLIAFGIALWRAGERRTAPTAPTAPPAAPVSRTETTVTSERIRTEPTVPVWAADTGTRETPAPPPAWQTGAAPPPPTGGPPPTGEGGGEPAWTPPPVPARDRSVLGQVTVGLALVTAGVLWLLHVAGVLTLGLGRIAAAMLVVVGLGLLLGSVLGRARWLIVVGIVLLPVVLVAGLLRPVGFVDLSAFSVRGPVGEVRSAPAAPDEVADSYQLGAGSLRLDLGDVTFEEDTRVAVQVGAGEVRITVPDDVTVDVRARVGAGEIRLFDEIVSGIGLERRVVDEVPGAATLEIDVQTGFGDVRVVRAPPSDDSA